MTPVMMLPVDFALFALLCLSPFATSLGRHLFPELWRRARDQAKNGDHGLDLMLVGVVVFSSITLLVVCIGVLSFVLRNCAVRRLLRSLRSSSVLELHAEMNAVDRHAEQLARWATLAHVRACARRLRGGFDCRMFRRRQRRAKCQSVCVSFLRPFTDELVREGASSSPLSEHEVLGRYGLREAIWEVHVVNLMLGLGFVVFGCIGSTRLTIDPIGAVAVVFGLILIWRWMQAARLRPFDWNDVIAGPGEVTIVGPLRSRRFLARNATAILYSASLNRVFIRIVEASGRYASFSLDFEATRRFVALWTMDTSTARPSALPPKSSCIRESGAGSPASRV